MVMTAKREKISSTEHFRDLTCIKYHLASECHTASMCAEERSAEKQTGLGRKEEVEKEEVEKE